MVRNISGQSISGQSISGQSISGQNISGQAPVRELPSRASLENLRNQAKTLLRQHREGQAEALARVSAGLTRSSGAEAPLKLHGAQLVLAREYGFASWPKLVEHLEPHARRVRREQGRVWIEGVPRLRWGSSPEPTYIGALEAAFRSSARPLSVTQLLGDSGLAFRLRWATRDGGNAWCGSGPCGEWPEEVSALNAATGYVFEFEPPLQQRPFSPEQLARITDHIDRGRPLLGFGKQLDMAVIFGYEAGGQRLLLSDYWASEEPSVMQADEVKEVSGFLQRIEEPAPRAVAVRAALALTLRRWHEGVVERDAITGATYHYGHAGYERWIADLERAAELSDAQRANLWFLNGWTYGSLHVNRSEHAGVYLRAGAELLPAAAQALRAAAQCYERVRERLGKWDPADPTFGMAKQKKVESWTPEVRAREAALLRDVYQHETQAMQQLQQALDALP